MTYQLYDVSPERTKKIKEKYKIKVITAITIGTQKDIDIYKNYCEISDLILFDGKGYEKSIGFNHELLNSVPISVNKMIAGNIKIEDISKFKHKDYYIDLSGSLENEEGKKDLHKLLNFATKVKLKKEFVIDQGDRLGFGVENLGGILCLGIKKPIEDLKFNLID